MEHRQKPASIYYLQRQYFYSTNTHQPCLRNPPIQSPITIAEVFQTFSASAVWHYFSMLSIQPLHYIPGRRNSPTRHIVMVTLHTQSSDVISSKTTWHNNGIRYNMHLSAAEISVDDGRWNVSHGIISYSTQHYGMPQSTWEGRGWKMSWRFEIGGLVKGVIWLGEIVLLVLADAK